MNHLKIAPQGLDAKIQFAQTLLYDALIDTYFLDVEGYGRVYKNERNGKIEPEGFKSGDKYTGNILHRQNTFFFSKEGKQMRQGTSSTFKQKVNVYFILNLREMMPAIAHRADSEVQSDIFELLTECGFDSVGDIDDTDLSSVLSEFKGLYRASIFDNLHPFCIFKFDTVVMYDITKKC